MSKKVSIVTFHCVPNYGAALQAYAMQEVLKRYFENVEILDYRPDRITKEYSTISCYSVFSFVMTLWSANSFVRRKKRFSQFIKKYMQLSYINGNVNENFEQYQTDMFILGSDQIWNPDITGGFDKTYFGDISCKVKPVVVSYAASIGKKSLSDGEQEKMKEMLKKVDKISVREPEAQEIVQGITRKDVSLVVDPTILAGRQYFEKFVNENKGKPYVLFYSLNGYKETEAMAEKIARYDKLQLIELSGRRKPLLKKNHRAIYDAGPKEFVSYIANADYVVTDSFHGTVFSLLFHKKIITIPHKTRGGRTKNLMCMAGLQERLTDRFDKVVVEKEINWGMVDKNLQIEREKSIDFLERCIRNE